MRELTFHLDTFDGPLDLLLSLLSKNKINIYDIPIAEILEQYLSKLSEMREYDMVLTSDFIAMASQLMYIKSKMLLPVHEGESEEDPRAWLVEALLEYKRFKEVSGRLALMGEIGRDIFVKEPEPLTRDREFKMSVDTGALVRAINDMLERTDRALPPPISAFSGIVGRESSSVNDKIGDLITWFLSRDEINFDEFLKTAKSRSDIIAIFLAVLELSKVKKITIEDGEAGYVLSLTQREDA